MIGRCKNKSVWRVLKIDRSEPTELNITEDPTTYTELECCDLLNRIHEGNRCTGGLKIVNTCYGIVGMLFFWCFRKNKQHLLGYINKWFSRVFFVMIIGFIKFLGPYYMLLITKRRKIGVICGHSVYAITKSEILPIPNSTVQPSVAYSKNENRSLVNSTCKCNCTWYFTGLQTF